MDRPMGCRNAVLFLIFNRPDTTMEVFEAIRQARPPRLYIASDGPRSSRPGEAHVVTTLRDQVISGVDWECEVQTLFRDANLGCRSAVSGAIGWFFEQEEQGIILEDDCLPSYSFFPFCDELLQRHAHDASIGGVTGDYRALRSAYSSDTYGRVGYPLIWGWASWRRVWKMYDPDLKGWHGDPDSVARLANKRKQTKEYLKVVFDAVKAGILNTWDFQFNFMCLEQGLDFLHPNVNMITNIGFASEGTHTNDPTDPNAALPRGDVSFPLKGPVEDRTYQEWLDRRIFSHLHVSERVLKRLQRWSRRLKPGA